MKFKKIAWLVQHKFITRFNYLLLFEMLIQADNPGPIDAQPATFTDLSTCNEK